jgi:hypothetical protein
MGSLEVEVEKLKQSLVDRWGGGTGSVRIIALLTALVGLLNVLSAVTPAQADRLGILDKLIPLIVQHAGRLTTALSGFALLILADGCWRWLCWRSRSPAI